MLCALAHLWLLSAMMSGLWSLGRPLSKVVDLDLGRGIGGKWLSWVLLGLLPAQL